eukprot:UN12353
MNPNMLLMIESHQLNHVDMFSCQMIMPPKMIHLMKKS